MLRFPLVWCGLALAAGAFSSQFNWSKPKDGKELIAQMRQRYVGKWYRTVTFTQKTTLPDKVETWYEALELPGKLRIDVAPLDSMKAILFRNDSIYQVEGGQLKDSAAFVHPLMVLGFDVYEDPAEKTIEKLEKLKFDLSKLYQTTWRGRSTYVVGATPGDTTSPQFWIDAQRLYFVRSFEPSRKDPSIINETRFDKYIRLGGGWLEMEVVFLANGEQRVKEEYSKAKANVKLDPAIFEPHPWTAPGWVK